MMTLCDHHVRRGMKATTSSNIAIFAALQSLVYIWILSPPLSFSKAWSTCACYSNSRRTSTSCSEWQSSSRRLHRCTTTTTTTNDNNNGVITVVEKANTTQSIYSLHLLSLPPTDDAFTKPGELLVRECWKWKDSVLGDGRDYFIPRPRALKAFHSLFVGMIIDVTVLSGIVHDVTLTLPLLSPDQSEYRLRLPLAQCSNIIASNNGSFFQLLPEHSFSERYAIEECVVLSNCARLDILLVLKNIGKTNTEGPSFSPSRLERDSADDYYLDSRRKSITELAENIAVRYAVAYNLHQQINVRRSKGTTLLERTGLSSWLDLPGVVMETSTTTSSITQDQFTYINQLGQRLISLEGPRAISTHLCLIACGLAQRANRPDREVIFRPYSSRDAHIMLQLKRTADVISVLNSSENTDSGGVRGRIKTVIDGALSAGKAARNEKIVPEITKLKVYGSDGTPPSALAKEVADAAIKQAVTESVAICVSRLAAMDTNTTEDICRLRQRVNQVVASLSHGRGSDLQKMANKLLHTPTMQLRQGILSGDEVEDVVTRIEKELIGQCGGI